MMKSERRHELETNVLADRFGAGIESTKSYLPFILGGVAVLAVGSLGWGLYNSSVKKGASEAWTEYYFNLAGGDADSFLDIAESFPGSTAAAWARVTAGSGYLERGLEALYVNKSDGVALIKQAIEQLEMLEKHRDPELRSKALMGLAQAHEALGDLETATKYYEDVSKATTQPRMLSKASERIAFLSSDSGKEFYAWFEKLDPKPDAPIQLPPNLSLPPMPGGFDFSSPLGDVAPTQDSTQPGEVDPLPLDPSVLPEAPVLQGPTVDPTALPEGLGPIDLSNSTGEVDLSLDVPDPANLPTAPTPGGNGSDNP